MNLVIGPNGTGKSTIVNAVCIAFGGNPRLLGRNPDLGSFVKHGAQSAEVEALIYDPSARNGVRTVKRIFDSDGKGYFEIDSKRAKQSEVVRRINQRYDIQLDNLSQFMPQERIAEFVNIKPDELLTITVRSLGGSEKEAILAELIKLDETVSSDVQIIERNKLKLEQLTEQQESDAGEVDAFRQQQLVRRRLDLFRRFVPVLEYEEQRNLCITLLEERRQLAHDLAAIKKEAEEVSAGPINACRQVCDSALQEYSSSKESTKACERDASVLISLIDDIGLKLSAKSKELADVEGRAKKVKEGVEKAVARLRHAENELSQEGDIEEHKINAELQSLTEKRDSIRTEISTEQSSTGSFERQKQHASRQIKHFNFQLKGLCDVRQQRLTTLIRMSNQRQLSGCVQLVHRMTAERQFEGRVYGPVAAEVEVDTQYHGRIMESCLRGFLMSAFVSENSRDSRILLDACRRELHGWVPDVISAPTTQDGQIDVYATESQVPQRPVDDRLKNLGIETVVSEIFKAPPSVRAALNAQAGLHNLHVGNGNVEDNREYLQHEEGLFAWYSPSARYQIIRSRYNSDVRDLRMETQFANVTGALFLDSLNETERERTRLGALIREEEDKLQSSVQELNNIDGRCVELRRNLQGVEEELRRLSERKNQQQMRRKNVEQMRIYVKDMERRANSKDIGQEKERLGLELRKLEDELVCNISKATDAMQLLTSCMVRLDELLVKRVCADRKLAAEQAKHTSAQGLIKEKEIELAKKKEHARREKEILKNKERMRREAFSEEEVEENKELFNTLISNSMESLQNDIAELHGKVQGLTTGGQQVVERFELRQRKIELLTEEVRKLQGEQDSRSSDLRQRKNEFLEWLKTGVEKMRRKFSGLYRRLGCSGDVELVNTDSERLSDLELQIMVSYRDDVEMRPISATANSGGEKMCCTMLFCFSLLLEEERMPPFVMVDELNQGLDPVNEMKIMTIMFEDAEKETAPQSFVITPKLLLNLPFHSRTKTHIIFNGSVRGKSIDITAPTEQ